MNTRFVIYAIYAAASLSAGCAAAVGPEAAGDAASRRSAAKNRFFEKTGGFVVREGDEGRCVFANLQSRVPASELSPVAETLANVLRSKVSIETGAASNDLFSTASGVLKGDRVKAAILIINRPGYPSIVSAPEDRWASVNVAALAVDNPSVATLAERTRREMWRSFAYLLGAADSEFAYCLMKPVLKVADLDALKVNSVCPEPMKKIAAHLIAIGIQPRKVTTYRRACEEGWAPTPTNQYQKAIWEQVKAKK